MAKAATKRDDGLLGLRLGNSLDAVQRIEQGLPFSMVESFLKRTGLTNQELSHAVGIPLRTLQRRRTQGRLGTDESDRLLRLSRVAGKATDLFEGDIGAAVQWLRSPARALRGERPIVFVRTETGAREVESLIDRLEHGVLS